MATEKQRRRRAKEMRHEYDLVEIDAEGNETVLNPADARPSEPPGRVRSNDGKGKTKKDAAPARGAGRVVPPPSWRRVLRRGLIFAPIMLGTLLLLGGGKVTLAGALVNTAFLMAVFIPFSYFMDRLMYRQHEKRRARATGG
jgi:hypothetical protein